MGRCGERSQSLAVEVLMIAAPSSPDRETAGFGWHTMPPVRLQLRRVRRDLRKRSRGISMSSSSEALVKSLLRCLDE